MSTINLLKRFSVALVFVAIGYYATPVPSTMIPVAHAGEEDIGVSRGEEVGALGWIVPKSRVLKIGSPNMLEGARVMHLVVNEGDQVKKGQILGYFSTYLKNKGTYEMAKASLALAQANLEKVLSGSKESDIQSQIQMVQSLKASEDAANNEFQRVQKLYQEKMTSKSQYDAAIANRNSLSAQRKSAEETLESLKTVRPEDVAIAKAQVAVSESELKVAKANLLLSTITAPIDGTILTIYAHDPEAVGDEGVLDIADLDVMDVMAEIDENDILKIEKGRKAEISIPGMEVALTGTIRDIGGQIKRNSVLDFSSRQRLDTRVMEIRIELDGSQNQITRRLINKKVRVKILP